METKKKVPELNSGDVAHSTQQGSLAEPPRDVRPQLGFRLRRQAAVDQRQAANRRDGQSGDEGAGQEPGSHSATDGGWMEESG